MMICLQKQMTRIYILPIVLTGLIWSQASAQNSSLLYDGPTFNSYGAQNPGLAGYPGAQVPSATQGLTGTQGFAPAQGQYARNPSDRGGLTLEDASLTYRPAPPARVFRLNDVITIRVDEITRVLAEGSSENRKRTLFEAILSDWIRITDFRLRPDPQGNGDPTIAGESNQQFRAESSVESRESMAFNIAATIVDIRPNGGLVLEARKSIRVNDNLWETALSGTCRADDVGPDNVVLSKDLLDLEIQKVDRGHLRDGYRRGWLSRFIDRANPF